MTLVKGSFELAVIGAVKHTGGNCKFIIVINFFYGVSVLSLVTCACIEVLSCTSHHNCPSFY